MEHVTAGTVRAKRGPISKLFRVLVAGGIALAGCAGCATTKSGDKPAAPEGGQAGSAPASQPEQPGGVRGW